MSSSHVVVICIELFCLFFNVKIDVFTEEINHHSDKKLTKEHALPFGVTPDGSVQGCHLVPFPVFTESLYSTVIPSETEDHVSSYHVVVICNKLFRLSFNVKMDVFIEVINHHSDKKLTKEHILPFGIPPDGSV